MTPARRHLIIGLGLAAATAVWFAALGTLEEATEPLPPATSPAAESEALALEVNQPEVESVRVALPDGDARARPDDYVADEEGDEPAPRTRPGPTDRPQDTPVDLRAGAVGSLDGPDAPPTLTPEVEYRREPGPPSISDQDFRAAIDGWPAPARCAKQVRGRASGTVEVELTFDRGGHAVELRPLRARSSMARDYVACLEAGLPGLEVSTAPRGRVLRSATFVF